MKKPELMAPAGDWTMLRAAVEYGADAVYLGIDDLNMRVKAKNFTLDDLPDAASFCKEHSVSIYLTVNIIIKEQELEQVDLLLQKAKEVGVHQIICWDFAVIQKCKEYGLPFCISTQASIANSEAAAFFEQLGAQRIVLARECTLEEIKTIRQKTTLEIEAFVHGAMCVAVSGRCFLSHHLFDKSGNRGDCFQPCRREYEIYDTRLDKKLLLGKDYVMSAKDLCTIEFIDLLIEAGIDSFKIEGRKRSPEYVAKSVDVYRRAIDAYFENNLTAERKAAFVEELNTVYNRGFSSGFYFKKPARDEFAEVNGNASPVRKQYVGKVLDYFAKPHVAYIVVHSHTFRKGDTLLINGPTTGIVELTPEKILNEDVEVNETQQGDMVTFYCERKVRRNDKVFVLTKAESQ
jgi:putative protease